MGKQAQAVKDWRKRTKKRIVRAMGGKCVCCGYDKCDNALDLHHIDPTKKELSFGKIRSNARSWRRIVDELRKCVLVCCRCHAEIHAGVRQLPKQTARFDENFVEYKEPAKVDNCPICQNKKPTYKKTCSRSCAAKKSRKVDWDKVDLPKLLKQSSYVTIADMLDITDTAVRKRAKKLGLIKPRSYR